MFQTDITPDGTSFVDHFRQVLEMLEKIFLENRTGERDVSRINGNRYTGIIEAGIPQQFSHAAFKLFYWKDVRS